MKKRKIVLLIFLALCAAWLVSIRYYRLSPVSVLMEGGFYNYIFKHYFSERDVLKFQTEEKK
ncbi:MAG: hypothetical protein QME65_04990, partial [Candidatus Omnitrophota bacterium]|nr:hypothetical protein [Candidatus Omnitrophota bacterium]